MRIYFLTDRKAALKLNGEYLGVIGSIEKYADIAVGEEVFAEVIPAGEFLPYSFFIGQSLFENPPTFLNVYLFEEGAQIRITHFERLDRGLNILEQRALDRLSVTLFELGGKLQLSCDRNSSSLYPLPPCFENCRLSQSSIGGFPVIFAGNENALCIISSSGDKLYSDQANSYSSGDMLGVTVRHKGCAGYFAERQYSYNGQTLKLVKEEIKRGRTVESGVIHFAFFEALLYGGDCNEYLSEDMQGTGEAIKEYLGDFTEVTVPHKAFYDKHGDIRAAALVYPIKGNLFEIKYFSVDMVNGKIDNLNRLDNT